MKAIKMLSALLIATMTLFFISCGEVEKKVDTTTPVAEVEFTYSTESAEALQQYKEGLAIFDEGDQSQARAYFEKAIAEDPDFAVAYVYRAWCALSPQDYMKYTKMANEKGQNLNEAEQMILELNKTFLANDLEKRLEVGKMMVEKFPNVARGYVVLGNTHEDLNDHTKARENFQKAIELRPDWSVGYTQLGASYLFEDPKDPDKAEANMMKVVELEPNSAKAHIALGDVYRAKQNLEKALASYQKAASLAPNDAEAYSKAGHANTFMGNYDQARKDFEKSGSLDEYPQGSLNHIAYTYLYEGKHAEGMNWLKEKAMNLNPEGMSADRLAAAKEDMLSNCMWTAYHMKDAASMKAMMDQVQPLKSDMVKSSGSKEREMMFQSGTNFREGRLALLEGKLDVAKEKAEAQKASLATIKNPNKLGRYHMLSGEIAMQEGKFADAVTHFEQAVAAGSNNMYRKYMLAMANKKAGNEEKAVQLLNEIKGYNFNNLGYALVRKDVMDMLPSSS